jgi:hypothetical protein
MTHSNPAPESGTKAQAFIARKGALVMKEFHPISTVESVYDGEMEIETLVFSVMRGHQVDRTYGVKVTCRTGDENYQQDVSLVDLDELPELLDGLRYLDEKYKQLTSVGITDYTELNYSTKGLFSVGFYLQFNPVRRSFDSRVFSSCNEGESLFFEREAILRILDSLVSAQQYLVTISEGSISSRPPLPPPPLIG